MTDRGSHIAEDAAGTMGQVAYEPKSGGARIRLAELIGGLSLAGELVVGFAEGKVLRTALIAVEIARRAGAATTVVQETYYTALIRFLGCTAFAHEEAHRYGAGDDNALRRTMAHVDPGQPVQAGRRIIRGIGRGAPLFARGAAVGRLLGDGRAFHDHTRAQCDASLHLVRTFGVSPAVGSALAAIGERWDGKGVPSRMAGEEIPLALRAFLVADVFELALMEGGLDGAISELRRRAGRHLDPRLATLAVDEAAAFRELAEAEDLWERSLLAEPEPHLVAAPDRLDDVAAAIGRIVDLKSVFMLGHSSKVAETDFADRRAVGPDARGDRQAQARRVPARHRADRLLEPHLGQARAAVAARARAGRARSTGDRAHPSPLAGTRWPRRPRCFGGRAPRRIRLSSAAGRAGARSFGAHSCRGRRRRRTPRGASAPAGARPRRDRGDPARRGSCRPAGRTRGGGPARRRTIEWARPDPQGLSEREIEVLVWVARGKTNPEIGILLGISAKTVQHHVAHIYEKIGVSSRAGAALFAMENGLLRDPD